ncbi:dihydroxyacetone kinase subunit DhaK [Mesobaculum littorinae]|uniref:Dihydroxyacetone kinase subunit DhaK n=1 Tax=Mesobaculum littorinae TaxID=2486419 RepID=A0A438AFP7_9RHOB|nr:dihydroxyacetone kinase family protein [Mesobaculum littorinae]RVV97536.1 dihydroxyacetone kinase subunit DhaK [Mesobaculum littorinae]
MKKLIDDIAEVVPDALAGLVAAHDGLALIEGTTTVVRADLDTLRGRGEVALISGGGSGHEPAHAGYVGPGLLTAAVAGDVFASPSTDAVLTAIRSVAGPGGVLLIVKNYTGDRLNFGLAAQIARAEGHEVDIVVVDDDAALGTAEETAGRRGIAGTIFVHKIAGAAAAEGLPLAEVKSRAEAAIGAVASMGVALSPCIVPAAGTPNFELGPDEIELGLGIHGEAGLDRVAIRRATDLAADMVGRIARDRGLERGEEVALMVNNLGATPPMEVAIMTKAALAACDGLGLSVTRIMAGTFLTAIDMAGASLSLMRLDDARRAALDAEARAPGWVAPGRAPGLRTVAAPQAAQAATEHEGPACAPALLAAFRAGARVLIQSEPDLTRLDQIAGDGDIGRSLAGGAEAVLAALPELEGRSEPEVMRRIGAAIRARTGGTSGPLYAILALGSGEAVAGALDAAPGPRLARAFRAGVDALAALGGAAPGDRTMLDALDPAASAMAQEGSVAQRLAAAAAAAEAGARETEQMTPRRGRSSYVGDRVLGHPDPGARAVALWLAAAAASIEETDA